MLITCELVVALLDDCGGNPLWNMVMAWYSLIDGLVAVLSHGDTMEPKYRELQGMTIKPGVRVLVTDRDNGCWDCEGTIVAYAPDSGVFDVEFENGSVFKLDFEQFEPTYPNTPEATAECDAWRAARQLRVFLCHGSEDKDAVRDFYKELRTAEMKPWFDELALEPGADWENVILTAVRDSHVVLVFLSKTSIAKDGYVQKEIGFALECAEARPQGSTYIIPVQLDDTPVPTKLAKWQWVSLVTSGGRERLITHLGTLAIEHFRKDPVGK